MLHVLSVQRTPISINIFTNEFLCDLLGGRDTDLFAGRESPLPSLSFLF